MKLKDRFSFADDKFYIYLLLVNLQIYSLAGSFQIGVCMLEVRSIPFPGGV